MTLNALNLDCYSAPTGWAPDFSHGRIIFVDAANYTIPNRAIRFTGAGPFELEVATFEGEDVPTVNGSVAYPKTERLRTARISCQMLFQVAPNGTPWGNIGQGMRENWADLNDIAALSLSNPQGLQTVSYRPWTTATTYTFEAHVLPPVIGEVRNGIGMSFGLVIEVPNPTTVLP
jgi:hypothetical protein